MPFISPSPTIGIAFLAGILSFISPCVLPLVPAYISYLGTRAAHGGSQSRSINATPLTVGSATAPSFVAASRAQIFTHGLMFVLGFTLVFVFFGLAVNTGLKLIGVSTYDMQLWLARIGGILVIFFALHVLGVTRVILSFFVARVPSESGIGKFLQRIQAVLYADTRRQMNPRNPYGYAGSLLMGIAFAAGWTPCVGPIYGAILTVAANGSTSEASVLLTAYSLGIGLPFLLAAIGIDRIRPVLKGLQRRMRAIELVSGVLLLLMGYLLLSGQMAEISGRFNWLADTQYRIEECTVGVAEGRIASADYSQCLDIGLSKLTAQKKQ